MHLYIVYSEAVKLERLEIWEHNGAEKFIKEHYDHVWHTSWPWWILPALNNLKFKSEHATGKCRRWIDVYSPI